MSEFSTKEIRARMAKDGKPKKKKKYAPERFSAGSGTGTGVRHGHDLRSVRQRIAATKLQNIEVARRRAEKAKDENAYAKIMQIDRSIIHAEHTLKALKRQKAETEKRKPRRGTFQ